MSDIITLTGQLDIYTAILLRDAADDEDCAAPVMAIDLNGIEFLDSAGIASLVTARRLAPHGGAESVPAAEVPYLRRLFEVAGLDRVLRLVPTPADLTGQARSTSR